MFVPLPAAAAMVLSTVAVGAAGKIADNSPEGRDGALARAARSVAAASVKFPVVVLIDDLDVLGPDLALVLAENLITRPDGQVLLVAVTAPIPPGPGREAGLGAELASRPWLAGRVHRADADPDMGPESRAELAAELHPGLSAAAVRRIGRRTATLAEVFKVCAEQRIRDAGQADNSAAAVAIVDEAIDVALAGYPVSALEKILAWAGGTVHARQAQAASATAELADAASAWGRVGAVIV